MTNEKQLENKLEIPEDKSETILSLLRETGSGVNMIANSYNRLKEIDAFHQNDAWENAVRVLNFMMLRYLEITKGVYNTQYGKKQGIARIE